MKKVLMLAVRMSLGHGVSVVIAELSKRLKERGVDVIVGCIENDAFFSDIHVERVPASPEKIKEICFREGIELVIAHTSPYFEVIPELGAGLKKYVWEHGDPSPEMFVFDREERQRIVDYKRNSVYPAVDQVIAISNFIKAEIGWPLATVIYNGSDHLPTDFVRKNIDRPLRVGFLTRMGSGEKFYKGGEFILELAGRLSDLSGLLSLEIMGRGESEDKDEFEQGGLKVYLNATDEERSRFLSEIDILVSLSLWEGFNLPLIEGQVSGALGLAFDVGAHPEVTPFVCSGITELEMLIRHFQDDRELLCELAGRAQSDCLRRFRWGAAVDELLSLAGR